MLLLCCYLWFLCSVSHGHVWSLTVGVSHDEVLLLADIELWNFWLLDGSYRKTRLRLQLAEVFIRLVIQVIDAVSLRLVLLVIGKRDVARSNVLFADLGVEVDLDRCSHIVAPINTRIQLRTIETLLRGHHRVPGRESRRGFDLLPGH